MYKLNVNGKWDFDFDENHASDWDIVEIEKNRYHLIKDGVGYEVEVLSVDHSLKTILLNVSGTEYEVNIKDKYDLLLEQLGMEVAGGDKIAEIKAPMPGLVTGLIAEPGDEIEKGTQVLVLEAMKMENVLKSPGSGVIKAFKVKQGDAVEKNQVLVVLE